MHAISGKGGVPSWRPDCRVASPEQHPKKGQISGTLRDQGHHHGPPVAVTQHHGSLLSGSVVRDGASGRSRRRGFSFLVPPI